MTNRLFVLLTLVSLIFAGCPSPESEERNRAFSGTLLFTSDGVIQRMDLQSGAITRFAEAHSPCATDQGTVVAVNESAGLVELSDNGTSRRVIVPIDRMNSSTHDDGFLDPQVRGERIAYHFAGNSFIVNRSTGAIIQVIDNASRPVWIDDNSVLLKQGDVLRRVDIATGESASSATIEGARDHSISPDRSRIALVEGKDLFVMNADGSNFKAIMSGHTELRYPVWSRDGSHIIVKDGCDLKLFKVSGGMVQSFKGRYFSFDEEHCPDTAQMNWH